MARILSLGTLVTRCKQRYDGQNNKHLDGPELKSLIDEYYADLHALVVEKGARYFEAEATITANGAESYALPGDHLTTLGVDFVIDGRRRALCGPIPVQRRDALLGQVGEATDYELAGNNLGLHPRPPTGTYKHIYAPQPVDLSTAPDSALVDVITIYGQKFIIWGVASVAKHKSDQAQQRAVDEHEKARAQVEYWACQRVLTGASARPSGLAQPRAYVDEADYR